VWGAPGKGAAFYKSVRDRAPRAVIRIDPFQGCPQGSAERPENLTDEQSATLHRLRNRGGAVWRACALKRAFRAIFSGDLRAADVEVLLDR